MQKLSKDIAEKKNLSPYFFTVKLSRMHMKWHKGKRLPPLIPFIPSRDKNDTLFIQDLHLLQNKRLYVAAWCKGQIIFFFKFSLQLSALRFTQVAISRSHISLCVAFFIVTVGRGTTVVGFVDTVVHLRCFSLQNSINTEY